MSMPQANAARVASVIYTGVALTAAALFAAGAVLAGEETVAVLGGAFWVGFLTLIIAMPLVIPAINDRARSPDNTTHH
jgi:hypothetical protein